MSSTQSQRGSTTSGLHISDVTVRFGGLVAVDSVTLHAPAGEVTGLIGPNGAGKTTIFNASTGLVRPAHGSVSIQGQDMGSAPPQARARAGLGRTFQRMELFDSLSVWDNVAMGREGCKAGRLPWRHLVSSRHANVDVRESTADALQVCGIEHLGQRRPSDLSTGERRLVELARVVAGNFRVMLLDEPSSGLDNRESERFGEILSHLVSERGVAMLIVEHDVALVMAICHYIYVLDFGQLIFEGTPDEVSGSPAVRAAYLGADDSDVDAGLGV